MLLVLLVISCLHLFPTVQAFSLLQSRHAPTIIYFEPRSSTSLYASRWGIRSKLKSFVSRIVRPRTKAPPEIATDEPVNAYFITNHENVTDKATPLNDETLLLLSTPPQSTKSTTTHQVDLTGSWKLIVDDVFLQQYQDYLTKLGQPFWVRSIALSIVARTTEETKQTLQGESLWIKGTNVRGTWERTLSTTTSNATLVTADGETVQYEAWWEGPVHVSWLRGVQKYGGGSFESRRFLKDACLVCESTFHPMDTTRDTACVTWTFGRLDRDSAKSS
ncbi:hypothetical protein FisN_31Lh016 [Fistulifera solaris]|uniref:Uncharacterized protein n=1 Tax=Fistulifera solaris TaxID=1519565 RepID=A0A1Z5K6E1_FISSO|nr:hypothetical protein FisN_31Lh016 [Fistulifera solaris]|eukprot:GAX21732.1 hypothetical protein FisN_31Lh016 [Fistulifera solaris]